MSEVTKTEDNALANLGISEEELIKESQENRTFERDETVIPFLRILQPTSPYVNEESSNYVSDSKPGMFYSTSTEILYNGKNGIVLVPVTHQKSYVEWIPIRDGGGFIKDWGEDLGWMSLCDQNQTRQFRPVTKDGHEIVYSQYFFVFIVNIEEGTSEPVILPFSGTQIKKARRWAAMLSNSKIQTSKGSIIAPHYFYPYLATTIGEKNEKGSWYGIKIQQFINNNGRMKTIDLINGKRIYETAKMFRQSLNEGTIRAATPERTDFSNETTAPEGDEVPF